MVFIRVLHSGRIGNWCSDGVFVEGGKPKNQKNGQKLVLPEQDEIKQQAGHTYGTGYALAPLRYLLH